MLLHIAGVECRGYDVGTTRLPKAALLERTSRQVSCQIICLLLVKTRPLLQSPSSLEADPQFQRCSKSRRPVQDSDISELQVCNGVQRCATVCNALQGATSIREARLPRAALKVAPVVLGVARAKPGLPYQLRWARRNPNHGKLAEYCWWLCRGAARRRAL